MIDEILNARHIRKSFPYGIVLDDINLNVIRGESLGIIGENGSGKSVLIRIIAGELKKDQGEIYFEDQIYEPEDISEAQKRGVYWISQKSMLLEDMTVAENLICVPLLYGFKFMTVRKMNALARIHLDEYGITAAPGALVKELSLVQKKQVEFLKIILKNPKLLILDGLFSSLDQEHQPWFAEQVQAAKQRGAAVLVASQNLEMVMDICDRIAIMQDAQIVQIVAGDDIYLSSLFAMMRRKDTGEPSEKRRKTGKKALTMERVFIRESIEASFTLYEGEILGIYMNDSLTAGGLRFILGGQAGSAAGRITVYGKEMERICPEELADNGICVILGEDLNQMLLYEDTVMENITFFCMKRAMRHGIRNLKMERLAASELAAECGITKEELQVKASCLSVGARQKLAFANSIAMGTRIYILDNIMSHVDYQSQQVLYRKMTELKKDGASFVFITKEFEELRIISDRILYVSDGRISDQWFY